MDYFFGNKRNDQGLCATEGCIGAPVHTFVYKYCEKCFAVIARDMEAGFVSSIERTVKVPDGRQSPPPECSALR